MGARRWFGRLARRGVQALWPNQRLRRTREGVFYLLAWLVLLLIGTYQQNNLILLAAGLAAGPMVSSVFASAAMLKKTKVHRRLPPYAFAGAPFKIEYDLENHRRWSSALALTLEDEAVPADRAVPGARRLSPRAFFGRVGARGRLRKTWTATAPARGRYALKSIDLVTAAPYGLLERRVTVPGPGQLVVYPRTGALTRKLARTQREVSESPKGDRHDRSAQPMEFHGMRDFRSGDSIRAIHWRTTARLGQVMVKEFEVQRDRDLVVLLDPWAPRNGATESQRETIEDLVQFAATVAVDACKKSGRRLFLGWTGRPPMLLQGPASIKLLHELLEHLAVLKAAPEGRLSALLELVPPAALRESVLVVASSRPVNLAEQVLRAARAPAAWMRGAIGRALVLDASKGELADYYQLGPVGGPALGGPPGPQGRPWP